MISNNKGELAQLKVQIRAMELGLTISKPTTEARYDFIIDENGILSRAQVKWGGYESPTSQNAVWIDLRKDGPGRSQKTRPYLRSEIDVLLVYIPQVDKVLRFGPDHFDGKSTLTIRIGPAAINREIGARVAQDFYW